MNRLLKIRLLFALPLVLALSGCGVLIGQMMVAGTGLKNFEVKEGDLATLRRGAEVLIVAPFATTGTGFESARGDDAARFAEGFERFGVFKTQFHFVQEPGKAPALEKELSGMTPEAVAEKLGLAAAPEYLFTGTILATETVVAPMHGVILHTSHRLRFLDLRTKKAVAVETEVKELFRDAISTVVEALNEKITGK